MSRKKRKDQYKPSGPLQGSIFVSAKGVGYVSLEGFKEDIEIDSKHLNTALHGDIVEIKLHPKHKGRPKERLSERQGGEVIRIIKRAKYGFSGVLENEGGIFFLKPDDTKMYVDILIPEHSLHGAKLGEKVFVEIISWREPRKVPEGKVVKIFGHAGENEAEMQAIAQERGFDSGFPKKVEEEAKRIKEIGITEKDYAGRRDFRKILTFTIDPKDAKDFDDAISFKELGNEEYEVGVHIADVTHYIKVGSEMDREAKERGTSVYLVDRTIPMLPEILSNDLCSLVPHKDRLTMSAVFIMDKNAKVIRQWFGRTVINSQKRFTYEEAENTIKNKSASLHRELSTLNNLAKKLTKERLDKGAMLLDQEEVKFVLDKDGKPLKVEKKVQGESNRLIEEFMLLANKKIAETISLGHSTGEAGSKRRGMADVFVYRIHDLPSKEKMLDLSFFLRSLGYKVSLKDGIIPTREINKILENFSGKSKENTMKDTVHRAVIRSMAKAIYSTKNVGHYGLAFPHYTHFTSPIRRYPDMLVHRFLTHYLQEHKIPKEKLKEYEDIAESSSEREKNAADAERASVKYKQVEYMSVRLGETFEGVISGVSEWGLYAEEQETKSEGLIRVRDMKDDYYVFNEKKLELLGEKSKKRYRLGDRIKIKVSKVDLERKTIDYALV